MLSLRPLISLQPHPDAAQGELAGHGWLGYFPPVASIAAKQVWEVKNPAYMFSIS